MESMLLALLIRTWYGFLSFLETVFFHDRNENLFEESTKFHELKLGFMFMFAFIFIREYIFGKLMVERMGQYLGVMVDTIALKLVNQWVSLLMHVFSTFYGVIYLSQEDWFQKWLSGVPQVLYAGLVEGGGVPMSMPFKVFYNMHLGYQLHALHFTIQEGQYFTADRRADYRQMLMHHVIAVALISFSYCLGYVRFGVLIMVSHNVSDIVVCVTKTAKLLGWQRMSIHLLPFMIITWLITRLIFFPICVIKEVLMIPIFSIPVLHVLPLLLCNAGLLVLLGLNIFWFIKFLQMAANAILSGSSLDVTESVATNNMADKYGVWNRQRWWQVGS